MELKQIIGERMQAIMDDYRINTKGMLQKELAAELGVTDNTISYYCNGKRAPKLGQIIQMSQIFGVSADYLLGLSDAPTTDKDIQYICNYTGLPEEWAKHLHYLTELPKGKETIKKLCNVMDAALDLC